MKKQTEMASLLRRLADLIEASSEKDFDDLLVGKPNSPLQNQKKRSSKAKANSDIGRDWAALANEIRSLPNREEGYNLLQKLELSKLALESLARAMNLPVNRQDNTDKLKEKIVEFGIGARLGSQAIRGN